MKTFNRSDLQTNRIKLVNFTKIKAIQDQARSTIKKLLVRSIAPVRSSRVLIGFSPAAIVEIDTESNLLINLHQYRKEVEVCSV